MKGEAGGRNQVGQAVGGSSDSFPAKMAETEAAPGKNVHLEHSNISRGAEYKKNKLNLKGMQTHTSL